MENRKGDSIPGARGSKCWTGSFLSFLVTVSSICVFAGGCASPGEPLERKALVPAAVTDLAATQQGDSVVLTFTMPKESVEHRVLKDPPTIEIYRTFSPEQPPISPATASGSSGTFSVSAPIPYVTIPASMVDRYSNRGFIRYTDTLKAQDFAQHSGWVAQYTVRTQTNPKKISADSNRAQLPIFPAPDAIDDVKAEVTHSAVVLTWTPPQKTIAGPTPVPSGYHIYRAEVNTVTAAPNENTSASMVAEKIATAKSSSPLIKIGDSEAPAFSDTQAEFGKTYKYSVRSFITHSTLNLESDDSNLVTVTPKDIFPPSAPQGLVIVLVPEQTDSPASLDLSWAISPETDIAGYNVYRSEHVGIPGQRLNAELLITPAFRDMNAVPGHRYFYTVTAVDRSGNESPVSAVVSSGVPAESSPAS
jgi:hypothetical protein